MFNCYSVSYNGRILGFFRTEIAAENFLIIYLPHGHNRNGYTVEGKYIAGIAF